MTSVQTLTTTTVFCLLFHSLLHLRNWLLHNGARCRPCPIDIDVTSRRSRAVDITDFGVLCLLVNSLFLLSTDPEVTKKIMLNSAEHETLNTHMYKHIKKFSSDNPRMLFFLLKNVKMPTVVGVLTFMSRKNFILN